MWQTISTILFILAAIGYLIKKYTSGKTHCDPEVNKCSSCTISGMCSNSISETKKTD